MDKTSPKLVSPEAGLLRIETARSGVFKFQAGVDLDALQLMLMRVEDAHRRFASMPILPNMAIQLEKEVEVSSVFGTNSIEGGDVSEAETAQILENPAQINALLQQKL